MKIYITTLYGDPGIERVLPFEFAKACGIFGDYTAKVEKAVNDEYEAKAQKFEREVWKAFDANKKAMTKFLLRSDPNRNSRWWTSVDHELEHVQSLCRSMIATHKAGERYKLNDGSAFYVWFDEVDEKGDVCVKNLPEYVPAAVFSGEQRAAIKKYVSGKDSESTSFIDGFARICELLSKAENHIMLRTNQNARTKTMREMVDETVHELSNLPRFTAYAKILKQEGQIGEIQLTIKEKITTLKVKKRLEGLEYYLENARARENGRKYCIERSEIEKEITERQSNWKKKPESPSFDEPPPTSY